MKKLSKSISGKTLFTKGVATVMACGLVLACGCAPKEQVDDVELFSPIKSVFAIGFMDVDGAKLKAIAVEYEQDLTGATVSADDYELNVYDPQKYAYMGDGGAVGQVTDIYVNDAPEIDENGGSGTGNYVIIELFTNYQCAAEQSYLYSMSVKVTQTSDITLPSGEVIEAGNTNTNNLITSTVTSSSGKQTTTSKLDPYGYVIPDIESFKYYTDVDNEYGSDGDPWVVKNCFNQQDGLYYDESLSYALYVPEDYDPDKQYGLVTLQNPAANKGTHPHDSLLATRSPSFYASEAMQEYFVDQHKDENPNLDGLIVLVPVITERVNDNGGTPAEYEAVVSLWDHIIDSYSIDTNYIYGSGQSVGGMILLETQRNRDNFFAGILLYEDQWAQNYYVDTLFYRDMEAKAEIAAETTTMHYPRTDANITWDYHFDTEGNKVYTTDENDPHDPYNLYYLISDDNIMIMNYATNNLSNNTWQELSYLYSDLTGCDDVKQELIDANDRLSDENAQLEAYTAREKDVNINWVSFENGSNGYSCRRLDSSYQWLLSQSRQTEMSREKLDLNKPFEAADEQIQTEDRKLYFTDVDGNPLYYITGKAGAGTQFYNTCWLNLNKVADANPGWLPVGMGSWVENGSGTGLVIEASSIVSAEIIGTSSSVTAVAIEYSKDMTDLHVNLLGDPIYGYKSDSYREDIQIEVAPFSFFDVDGKEIACSIKNVYVNTVAETKSGAAKGSGSGTYLIVEFETPLTSAPVSLVQRTTLRTEKYIASALPWTYTIG